MSRPPRLWNRHFALLWQGQFVSQVGNQLHTTAMMFWVKHATGSAGLMGLMMMFATLPGVLLGPLGGTLADRFSRKRIIVLSDLICGIGVLLLAGLLFLAPNATGPIAVWLFAISILIGTVGAFFRPAISAALPDLVPPEKIAAANSLTSSSVQVSVFAGQGLGGMLFRLLGAPTLFLANGVSYIVSAFLASFIEIPQSRPAAPPRAAELLKAFRADTAEGLRYVWRRRGMRNLFLAAAVLNFLTSPISVLLPFFVEDRLHATTDWFGFLIASIGIGSLLGYALAGLIRASGRVRCTLIIVSLALAGIAFALFGSARTAAAALPISLVIGLLTGLININLITILQRTTASEIRGRVFGLLGTLSMGLTPIGMGLTGMAAELTERQTTPIFVACGLTMTVVTLLVATDRDFRQYLAYEERPDGSA